MKLHSSAFAPQGEIPRRHTCEGDDSAPPLHWDGVPPAARSLAMIGAAMLATGGLWSLVFPIVKDIWSSSFVLVTSGVTVLALAALAKGLMTTEQRVS